MDTNTEISFIFLIYILFPFDNIWNWFIHICVLCEYAIEVCPEDVMHKMSEN